MNARAERTAPRKPGRPATYVFNKPDNELSEAERKLKLSIEKRRLRQNRSYHRRKALRAAAQKATEDAAAGSSSSSMPTLSLDSHDRSVPNLDPATALRMAQMQEQANQASLIAGMKGSHTDLTSVGSMSSNVRGRVEQLDAASLAARWKLPTPSSCVPLVPVGPSRTSKDSTVAPATTLNLTNPTSLIGASLVPDVDEILEDDDHETEALVQNALMAAQSSIGGSKPEVGQLRDAMDQQRDLLRLTGIKEIVFENLRTQFMAMPVVVQAALQHLVVFPSSFDARAAVFVAGSDPFGVNEMLQNLVGSNFVNPVGKGRFQLNETVKVFMREDQAVVALDSNKASYQTALTRFRSYFRQQLEQFQGEHIHKVGWQREKAMLVYDSERKNMQFSEFLSQHNSREMLRDFLAAGITVMRYCVRADEREAILIKALEDDEVSSQESVLLNGNQTFLFNQDDPEVEAARSRDLANKARLQLALSEAYFDQLKLQEAEEALLKALNLMGGDDENGTDSTYYAISGGGGGKARVVDSVLVLLLLSNVRMSKRRVREARTLCVKALRILAAAGLGRSTFGINAMANLTVIYLEENQLDKASVVATRLVDTLNNMGYTKMPIFADALGVVGKVSMAQARYHDAEQQFGAAIEIVKLWANKEWTARPVFHCLDLDLWLLESLASAIAKQGRTHEASLLQTQAQQTRKDRGLSSDVTSSSTCSTGMQDQLLTFTEARRTMRHLY